MEKRTTIDKEYLQNTKNRYGIIGQNPKLNQAIERALKIAPTELAVLIIGENGVGKDVFSKIIHDHSRRANKGYFAINCGAIPEGTIDSELFGHEKGAFTGAYEEHKGYFETFDGGTIFLDEIAELPLTAQSKLLRVLESGEYIRMGSATVRKTNVRIIAATNRNLRQAMEEGKFRSDLYYRLYGTQIQVPPLRERKEDIPILFRKFAADTAEKYNFPERINLTAEAEEFLKTLYWRGNIRQFKNKVEEIAVSEADNIVITVDTLRKYIPADELTNTPTIATPISDHDLLYQLILPMKQEIEELKRKVSTLMQNPSATPMIDSVAVTSLPKQHVDRIEAPIIITPINNDADGSQTIIDNRVPHNSINNKETAQDAEFEESMNHHPTLDSIRKETIIDALQRHNNRRAPVARELGISERTLYRKLKDYGIN